MDSTIEALLRRHVSKMLPELERRTTRLQLLDSYYDGPCPPPRAVVEGRLTRAYRLLVPVSSGPWGGLVADSVQDQLEVAGVRSPDREIDRELGGVWADNQMSFESKLAINAALVGGRAFALVWPDATGQPRISIDRADAMIVQYREGSRRERVAAMRRWTDDDERVHITVYLADRLYKLEEAREQGGDTFEAAGKRWQPRASEGSRWIVENPFGVVPVVELPVNQRLRPGAWGHARGEYEHVLGLIDRINLLTFLGAVVAFYMGFPLRGVIGERLRYRVLRDDDGNEISSEQVPPFDANAGGLAQLENRDAEIFEYRAADRRNLDIYSELAQLAALTKTPQLYMPMGGGISNISADTIRGLDGALQAKVNGLHKPSLGAGFKEVYRLCGLMMKRRLILSPRAELLWIDRKALSLAERADAFTKLAGSLPWQAAAELALQISPETITRWEGAGASNAFGALIREVTRPTPDVPQTVEELAAA